MSKKRVLVVDDEPALTMLLKDNLELEGFEVTTASNGREGLETAQREKPDLILLDVAMPEMNGIEMCQKIKNDGDLKSIPVIFLSAFGQQSDIDAGMQAGAFKYFIKPCDMEDLLAAIQQALGPIP
ncbi:MAG: response regulator [Elusimicrobia bacterium]|nr:response regulator [Elusimicrobiota bacterium]